MWSDPVKVKHWEECLDTDTHIFFRASKFSDWSAYGAIQSVGRRETLKASAIPDLTQPTIFLTQDAFFAPGMGCPSPDIVMKYLVSRHRLPGLPSRTPQGYEATCYCLVENIPPPDLVDELCALQLEGEENWEDITLQGHDSVLCTTPRVLMQRGTRTYKPTYFFVYRSAIFGPPLTIPASMLSP